MLNNLLKGMRMKKLIIGLVATLTFATSAFAAVGDSSADLVFTPVTPCRILDTRGMGARTGLMAAASTRLFYGISSTNNFPGQGGSSPNCNVLFSVDVAALVLNFTVVTPSTGGYITAYPSDAATRPLAATVNFAAGAVVGNNATLKIEQTTGNGGFNIYTTSDTHVVADVVGYYAKPRP
jgi:hypothetical protein